MFSAKSEMIKMKIEEAICGEIPELEPLKQAISITNTTITELMQIREVEGVYIAVSMNPEYCDITTRAGNIKQRYDVEELRTFATEAYCPFCCCAENPFSETCADCVLYEFMKVLEENSRELDIPQEDEEE